MNQTAQDIGSLSLAPELLMIVERYAVYRCYSDSGELLYIGITGTVGRRLGDHLQKAWFTQVRGMTFEWYADELDARNAERRAIHIEHPKYNVIHRNSASIQRPAPARHKRSAKSRSAPPIRSGEESEALVLQYLAEGLSASAAGLKAGLSDSRGRQIARKLAKAAPRGVDSDGREG